MCGITGVLELNSEPVLAKILQGMTDAIAHRGPDGEGQWIDENVGIGHRRLAILDLSSAGHQPMLSANHRFVLSYNGEVYNFRELRFELEQLGYWFGSQTDTEVVLNALVEWGVQGLEKFNGMFALALWDRKKKTLLLARDRYGVKPLYYSQFGSTFLFGSEQKAILAHPNSQHHLDKEALIEYFTFQNIFTDRTLLKNIKILPAGHYAVMSLSQPASPQLKLTCYWDYQFGEPEGSVDVREYQEELDRLLCQAVKRQLVADVEMGAYLSGGMDSGTLTALAARQLPYIKTFTCGFDLSSASGIELGFDERVKAEAMSARFKTEHYEMVLKSGDMERCLPKLTWHLEEPRIGQSYPNYYVAQLASKFVKVVLSGTGGDELFGGYPWRYYRTIGCDSFEHYIDQYYLYWQRLLPNKIISQVFAPIWESVKHVWTRDIFRNVFLTHKNQLSRPEDYINHSLYFEAKTFLHGLFVVEDKLSMAHGLETRVPFMDNDLVEFAMGCPVGLKLNHLTDVVRINENEPGRKSEKYFQKTHDGKQILRDVMEKYIPPTITTAAKQGFSAPDSSWFKSESIDLMEKTILDGNSPMYLYLDSTSTSSLILEHLSGFANRRLLIWSLLSFNEWISQHNSKKSQDGKGEE